MPSVQESRERAKTEKLQAHRVDDNKYIVYNIIKHTSYEVVKTNNVWVCTCPFATKGSHLRPGFCKHLVRVMDRETGCDDCGRADLPMVDHKCTACRFEDRMRT